MRLYRSKGHIWTGTEADAKLANDGNKGWEKVEVPTTKPELIAWLNENAPGPDYATAQRIMAEQIALAGEVLKEIISEEQAQAEEAPAPKPDPVSAFPLIEKHPHKNKRMANLIERISVEEVIWACDEAGLISLQGIINARREELSRPVPETEPLPAPRPRVRTRVQPVAADQSEEA